MTQEQIVRNLALRYGPLLAENNKREQEALQGYYALLNDIDMYCCEKAVNASGKYDKAVEQFWQRYLAPLREQIEEFISDELNHAARLHELMVNFGKIKEAKV